MKSRSSGYLLFLAAVIWLSSGCGPAGTGAGVFPDRAELGDTVAVALDSNNVPAFDHVEKYDLTASNVSIRLEKGTDPSCFEDIPVRSVFDAGLSKTSERAIAFPGASITAALFDIPANALACDTNYPLDVNVKLLMGTTPDSFVIGALTIVGDQGAPTIFGRSEEIPVLGAGESLDERFGRRPTLRLRPLAGDGTTANPGFDTNWVIGSVEFDLQYESDLVTSPVAYTATEAENGTAIVGPGSAIPQTQSVVAHVVLMDPVGFTLVPLHQLSTSGGAGEGPMVDIAFDKLLPFTPGDFEIENLVVTRLDGTIEVDLRSTPAPDGSKDFFSLIAVEND